MKEFYMPNRVSLGRWNIEKCEKKMFTKTDYSNEDHCGTCSVNFDSQAMIIQLPLIKTKENANMINGLVAKCSASDRTRVPEVNGTFDGYNAFVDLRTDSYANITSIGKSMLSPYISYPIPS
jgi:transcription elongation factor Elf1